ncbi:hypothetical protein ONZ45_g1790 [Pleurotus djamor]|nr:hypothetical protein ONZ45_g1790 [Pleurotus djamor]
MVDWTGNVELKNTRASYSQLTHTVFGLYLCEWLINIQVDWRFFVSRKERLRWPMILYFVNRYCLLVGLITSLAFINFTSPQTNCQAWFLVDQTFIDLSLVLATALFSLRISAAWAYNYYMMATLIAASAGQISLLIGGIVTSGKSIWVNALPLFGCGLPDKAPRLATIASIYSAALQVSLLLLFTYTYFRRSGSPPRIHYREPLFLAAACVVTVIAATFKGLALNPTMYIIADIPATIISTIAGCRTILSWQGIHIDAMDRDSPSGVSRFVAPSQTFMENTSFAFQRHSRAQRINVDIGMLKGYQDQAKTQSPTGVSPTSPASFNSDIGYTTNALPYAFKPAPPLDEE